MLKGFCLVLVCLPADVTGGEGEGAVFGTPEGEPALIVGESECGGECSGCGYREAPEQGLGGLGLHGVVGAQFGEIDGGLLGYAQGGDVEWESWDYCGSACEEANGEGW